MRRNIIAGNWKMNMLPNEAINFIEELEPLVKDTKNEVIICVPFTDFFYANNMSQDTNIKVGVQNMHYEDKGAYTGEISAPMLKSVNCKYVIIGHSERRQYFNETDEIVNKKVKKALEYELLPIMCVGETLEEKEAGKTIEIITNQIEKGLQDLNTSDLENIVIAYEPIWAIGTGKTATSEDAQNAIKAIREKIKSLFNTEDISILYGGSVKGSNAKELFEMEDIDGGLVGGASLEAKSFAEIVNFDK